MLHLHASRYGECAPIGLYIIIEMNSLVEVSAI